MGRTRARRLGDAQRSTARSRRRPPGVAHVACVERRDVGEAAGAARPVGLRERRQRQVQAWQVQPRPRRIAEVAALERRKVAESAVAGPAGHGFGQPSCFAAHDLGAKPWKAFLTVTLPLSAPGILAGSLLVFIPAVGEFVIPALLGGPDQLMIGKVLWTEFFNNRDWPLASAVAIAMLALLVAPIMFVRNALGVKE